MTLSTPNLGLLAPEGGDPVPGGDDLNALTLDRLDEVLGSPGPNLYTPALFASSSDPNLGSTGTITGQWYRFVDMVIVWVQFKFGGTGIDAGNGFYRITMPVAPLGMQITTSRERDPIGKADLRDDSDITDSQTGVVSITTEGGASFVISTEVANTARTVTNDIPFVWATGDACSFFAKYRGAFNL